ncbi:Adenylosuccinate synthetase [Symbiodinium microadriaticum]|uniref:Adenylosuccinate synthetase n=1 Tax=Symbiodinium microadriaticum TaxID=2951 RepID=A0A1Q9D4V7_SYMMI|nr:Adenylosuccinate synthetase [Symbiodinium microadriaticum]
MSGWAVERQARRCRLVVFGVEEGVWVSRGTLTFLRLLVDNVRVRLDSAYFDLLIPSTALVCLHIPTLMKELEALKEFDPQAVERVFISTRAHILLDSHQIIDGILEAEQGSDSIGTTKRGIGPCYSSKAIRNGVRFGDLLHFEEFERKVRDLTTLC